MRLAWAAVAAVWVGGASAASAAERAWTVVAEPGAGRIHHDGETAPAGALRVLRGLGGRGVLRAEAGLAVSTYGAVDVGLEARLCPSCRVSPVLGVGGGLLAEEGYGGSFARATAGVEAVLAPRLVLRATVQAGTHDGQAGPHLAAIGLGWRF
jgi:hypothetical protein